MTMTQMGTLVVILVLAFVAVRLNLHKKLPEVLPGALVSLRIGLRRLLAGVTYHQVDVQGYDLAYLDGGRGETVLLLHGFASEKDDWLAFARRLRGKYRVVILDLPGFGESSRIGHNKYDIVSQVRRLRAFKEKLNLPSVHIVGCHIGATIGAIYGSLFANEVLSLTLIEPFGLNPPVQSDVERLSSRGWSPLTAGSAREYERVVSLLYRSPPSLKSSLLKRRLAQAIENQGFEEQMWKHLWENRPYLLEQVLSEVKVRSLLLWGDSNKVAHQAAAKIVAQGLPSVTTALLKNAGHLMIVERPKEVAEHFLRFAPTSS
jgi:pimeloyl-ACP methyl ester carboxylesterase